MTLRSVGAIGLEVDGQTVEVAKMGATIKTGIRLVKTMNSSRFPSGHSRGMREIDLTVTVAIPLDRGEPDWDNMFDATITVYPLDSLDKRTMYLGCAVLEYTEQYQVDGEGAMRDLKISALRKEDQ